MSFGRPRVFQTRKMWKSKIKSGEKYVYIEYSKNRVIAKIKILDFLLNLCYDKMIINNKKYIKLGNRIEDIIKYTNGWIKSIK